MASDATPGEQTVTRADGLVLRSATAADAPGILALSVAAHGENDAGAVTYLLERPERWAVVMDGERVASTAVLLDHEGRYGSVPLRFGQVEYVATDPAYRRRGLVRALFEHLHQRSADLGQHLTVISGIPYFYRRLGYQYGLQYPPRYRILDRTLAATDPWTVGPATPADVDALVRLHEAAHAAADLVTFRPRADWEWLVSQAARHGEEVFVARRDGRVEGFGRLQRHPGALVGRAELYEAAAESVEAGRALLAHARNGELGEDLAVVDRPGTPFSHALHGAGEPSQDYLALYTRLPDPVGFLRHVRPALSQRLAASGFAGDRGTLTVSLYDRTILLPYDRGEVGEAAWGPAMEDPFEQGHAGVAPDSLDALLLGRFGASGLDDRVDDVMLGPDRPLLDVLFPALRADVPMTI